MNLANLRKDSTQQWNMIESINPSMFLEELINKSILKNCILLILIKINGLYLQLSINKKHPPR